MTETQNNKVEWVSVYEISQPTWGEETCRAAVTGGWLFKHETWAEDEDKALAMCFVPDTTRVDLLRESVGLQRETREAVNRMDEAKEPA